MINIISSNLFIIIVILTLSGWWLVLPTSSTNTLLQLNETKSFSDEIHNTASKEFDIGKSSNILGNFLNRDENITLLIYSPAAHDSTPESFENNSWHLTKTSLEKHETSIDGSTALRTILDGNIKIHNEINKSNQENNLNNKKIKRYPTHLLSNIKLVNSASLSPSSSPVPSTASVTGTESTNSTSTTVSSYFERVEVHESLTHTKTEKFLLHRNKRYLLFPEGSSFQLVFDLIIPIVDYTNFAIMGITCAVAWELPSKPPSEIIENIRTKLNDGTYGISRRNDSTQQPLEYINSQRKEQEATDGINRWRQGVEAHNHPHYLPQLSAATIATTSGSEHFIKNAQKPPLPQPSSNFYYNNYVQREKVQQPTAAQTTSFNGQHPQQQQQKWHNDNYETFDTNQRKTLYDNKNEEGPMYRNDFTSPVNKQLYNNDHHHQHHHHHSAKKWNIKNWQQQMHQQRKQIKTQFNDAGDYWNRDNWWDNNNKNRIEQHWQKTQQQKWSYQEKNPKINYQAPMFSKRKSRNRKILNKPPKHRIYPIFGKRRRRRRSSADDHRDDDVTEKLHEIHTGEHLRTRQKLYGKIEKLYQTRGLNGTACVLRALCEATKRMHLNYHHNETPQSFVMELLRTIFALPKETPTESKESSSSSLHVDDRYMNAVLFAHDITKNCSEQYNDCEYSITFDS